MADPKNSDEAGRNGYTRQVIIEGEAFEIGVDAVIEPDADLNGTFRAFDLNHQRMLTIDGPNVDVRENS